MCIASIFRNQNGLEAGASSTQVFGNILHTSTRYDRLQPDYTTCLYIRPLAHPGQKGTRSCARRSTRSTWARARHLVNRDRATPRYLSDQLTLAADALGRPSVQLSSRGDFIVPRKRRKFGDRAFSVAAPRAWNRLPLELTTFSK